MGAAGNIVWSRDLVESGSRETDIWYTQTVHFRATGQEVSTWFSGSQRSGDSPFHISLDEVKSEKTEP